MKGIPEIRCSLFRINRRKNVQPVGLQVPGNYGRNADYRSKCLERRKSVYPHSPEASGFFSVTTIQASVNTLSVNA